MNPKARCSDLRRHKNVANTSLINKGKLLQTIDGHLIDSQEHKDICDFTWQLKRISFGLWMGCKVVNEMSRG